MTYKRYINLPPNPSSFIESVRHFGYSMETAVADIIDNSITAKARHIDIRFAWDSGNPWLAIVDDGYGMTKDELVVAMRFGSRNPKLVRDSDDLGRFGIGLKTASLSQCRHLSVISKKSNEVSGCEWDIDKFESEENDKWPLGFITYDEIRVDNILFEIYRDLLENSKSGTIVLWKIFDRIEERGVASTRERYFNSLIDNTRKHLELVFHRFLNPDPGSKKITISMNGNLLEAFNPFNPRNIATQELTEQIFRIDNDQIRIQAYVLPHHNKVPREEYEKYEGEGGYVQNQGFYVYRNRRLLINGTWFQLRKKDEMSKLIRIRVDIPNTLDHLWKINVLKSGVTPPDIVRRDLKRILGSIEIRGKKVYTQRGHRITSSVITPVWNRIAVGGQIMYRINRKHLLLQQLLNDTNPEKRGFIENIISTIEGSFPTDLFYSDVAGSPEQVQNIEFTLEQLEKLLDVFIPLISSNDSLTSEELKTLLTTDPFASNTESTITILKEKGIIHD